MNHTITVRFEIHEGDVTDRLLMPLPKVGTCEVLQVAFADGQWEVTNADTTQPQQWRGRAEYKYDAVLNYLRARLGMYDEKV